MDAQSTASANRLCDCLPVEPLRVAQELTDNWPSIRTVLPQREHVFASSGVLLAKPHLQAMENFAKAMEAVITLPPYQQSALQRVGLEPAIEAALRSPLCHRSRASRRMDGHGLFMGYDFHVGIDGPRLIEINTNAGGAFLYQELLRSAQASAQSCAGSRLVDYSVRAPTLVDTLFAEWCAQGHAGKPQRVLIVDEQPEEQYLYPDMLLAQAQLEAAGVATAIADIGELSFDGSRLWHGGEPVDMVYNRLTDFYLDTDASSNLRRAWNANSVVVSPSPVHHALFANKSNLLTLANRPLLAQWGVAQETLSAFDVVLDAHPVNNDTAAELWRQRKDLVFKPRAGFGSRGVYRGAKMTRKVWAQVQASDYIAQALVPAPERSISLDNDTQLAKFDLRLYTYAGEPLSVAARVYQGQVTNFRTPGGGFAPVYVW